MKNIPKQVYNQIDKLIRTNLPKIEQEISETKELSQLLYKWSRQGTITSEEKKKIKTQLFDILKSIPTIAIFLVPFGTIILFLLIKYLPFNILPSSFAEELEQPGQNESDKLESNN